MTAPLRLRWRKALLDPDLPLSWCGRLLGFALAEHAANESAVLDPAPSAATLAGELGTSVPSIHRGRRELKSCGMLSVVRRTGRPSRMRLLIPSEPLSGRQGPGGSTPVSTSVQTSVSTSVPRTPEQGEQGEQGEHFLSARERANADGLVAHFVNRVKATGAPRVERDVGMLAAEVGALREQGIDDALVRRAIDLLVERQWHPRALSGLVREAATGSGPSRGSATHYTGCRAVRGTHGVSHVPDPLGRDKPPHDWRHERPSADEIRRALAKQRGEAE